MIKKYFIILFLILLLPSICLSWGTAVVGSGSQSIAPSFCDCGATDVLWCWEVTNTNTTITASGGCADAGWDTTGTAASAINIVDAPTGKTGSAVHWSSAQDYYSFSLPTGTIDSEGTVVFDIYLISFASSTLFFWAFGNSNVDELAISLTGTDEIYFAHYGNSNSVLTTTTAANLVLDTWYTITVKWRQGATDPSLSINANSTTITSNTDLTNWEADSTGMRIGNSASGISEGYIKNIRIYSSWQ